MECLKSGKICPNNNLKCKECKLLECKNTIKSIEEAERMWFKTKEDLFYEELEKKFSKCSNCNHLEIIDIYKGIVRCPYMIKEKCILSDRKVIRFGGNR